MSISTAPERALGFVGSIIKGRYSVNAISSVSRDVVVYAAEEIRYGRPIALEVLRDGAAADPEFSAAVWEQASALALSPHVHRGLPRVYECGRTETGELFIALQPAKGSTLRELLDARGPLDPATALRIASQVGEALETLHHSRIVHGELGAESVVLVRDDHGNDRVTLVGVELTAARRTPHGRGLRASGSACRAPEQVAGDEITEAVDQYALGLLLRELLTPDRSRGIDTDTEAPPLPPDIARIIATALEAHPSRRFPDISVMVNDLWAAQTALAESAPRPRLVGNRVNARRHARPRRSPIPLRIAAAVATAGVIAAVVWFALSGALASRVRALVPAPAVTAVPALVTEPGTVAVPATIAVPAATPVPVRLTEPATTPPAPSQPAAPKEPTTVPAPLPIRNGSAADGFAHPSAAPRPAPPVERQERAAPEPPASNGADGTAIIDWVLNRRR